MSSEDAYDGEDASVNELAPAAKAVVEFITIRK